MNRSDFTKKWVNLAQEEVGTKVIQVDDKQTFIVGVSDTAPISHIRFNIFPDGGINRLRIFGKPAEV